MGTLLVNPGDVPMVNLVVVAGEVSSYGPKIEWSQAGKPMTSWTLIVSKGEYKTFVPCCCVGNRAEHVCEVLEPGSLVLVQGSLSWKAGKTKDAGKLQVVCFDVEVLRPALEGAAHG